MNPVFIFLVLIAAFVLWLLLSFAYIPVGKFFNRLFKDSHQAINGGGKIDFMEDEKDE